MRFFFAALSKFFEKYKRLNDYIPDENEVEAGIQRINNLSSFGTPLSVARRSNMTVEECLQRPSDEIYMILVYDFEQAEYQKRLNQIHQDNQAMQNALSKK